MKKDCSILIVLLYSLLSPFCLAAAPKVQTYKEFIEIISKDLASSESGCNQDNTLIFTDLDNVVVHRATGGAFVLEPTFESSVVELFQAHPHITFNALTARVSDPTSGAEPYAASVHVNNLQGLHIDHIFPKQSEHLTTHILERGVLTSSAEEEFRFLVPDTFAPPHPDYKDRPPIYIKGSLLTSGRHKGHVLNNFFKQIGLNIRNYCLYFVDDELNRVQQVIEVFHSESTYSPAPLHFKPFQYIPQPFYSSPSPQVALRAFPSELMAQQWGHPPSPCGTLLDPNALDYLGRRMRDLIAKKKPETSSSGTDSLQSRASADSESFFFFPPGYQDNSWASPFD